MERKTGLRLRELCLESAYQKVRKFLSPLLRVIKFGSTAAGEPVLASLHYLRSIEEKGSRMNLADPPLGIVSRGWRRYVINEDGFDRKAYLFCCLDRLRSSLRKRDIFIAPSYSLC